MQLYFAHGVPTGADPGGPEGPGPPKHQILRPQDKFDKNLRPHKLFNIKSQFLLNERKNNCSKINS